MKKSKEVTSRRDAIKILGLGSAAIVAGGMINTAGAQETQKGPSPLEAVATGP